MSNQIKGTVTGLGRAIPDTLTETANDPFKLALGLATGGASVAFDTAGKALESNEVATPAGAPPPTMPTADSEEIRKAARRRVALLRNRGGRQSTILTGGSDTFGG